MTKRLLETEAETHATGGGLTPPLAAKRPVISVAHGVSRTDDYAWLKAENWQQVMHEPAVLLADIRDYLEAENAYTEAAMADVNELRDTLFTEMRGRIKEDDSSVPSPDGPYAYGVRFTEGAEHPLIIRTDRDGGNETVLLDANRLAEGKAYFHLGGTAHSPDHRLLAYAFDEKGSEYFEIRIRDLTTGKDLADIVLGTTGYAVWAADSATFFYVWVDENHRPSKVFRHVTGDRGADPLVFADTNPGYFLGVGETQSQRYVLIDSHDHETSEVHVVDVTHPGETPRLVAPRRPAEKYHVDHAGELFYILTNAAGAEDYKIVTAPIDAPDRANWRDLVPHKSPGRLILHATVYKDHLVRLERESGLPRIVIRHLATGEEHTIDFDEEAYALGMLDGSEFDTTSLRFTYSSMTTPARVYDYDMVTRTRVLRKEDEIPSGHNPADYVTRRVFAPTADGETVPVSLLYRRDTPIDGTAPCLLYGYGAYGVTIAAAFSSTRLSLVDRGFLHAIAHVRGGKDKGFHWYADGRREKKVHTFTDFIAAARYLVAEKIVAPDKTVASGGSAGGLLVGAIANMAPELFAGLIAEVPFVDVLNTMLDASLPLTPPEWPEWGNPIESAADFATIAAYSPYDNVARQAYPAILALAGLTDPRVTYWEPAKWVARLRAMKTDSRLLVLKTNMEAGHGGAAGRFVRLLETAFATAFALKVTGRA